MLPPEKEVLLDLTSVVLRASVNTTAPCSKGSAGFADPTPTYDHTAVYKPACQQVYPSC